MLNAGQLAAHFGIAEKRRRVYVCARVGVRRRGEIINGGAAAKLHAAVGTFWRWPGAHVAGARVGKAARSQRIDAL